MERDESLDLALVPVATVPMFNMPEVAAGCGDGCCCCCCCCGGDE